jgi:hypothetical protein
MNRPEFVYFTKCFRCGLEMPLDRYHELPYCPQCHLDLGFHSQVRQGLYFFIFVCIAATVLFFLLPDRFESLRYRIIVMLPLTFAVSAVTRCLFYLKVSTQQTRHVREKRAESAGLLLGTMVFISLVIIWSN